MFILVFTMILIVATMILIVFTKIGNVLKHLKYAWGNRYIHSQFICPTKLLILFLTGNKYFCFPK